MENNKSGKKINTTVDQNITLCIDGQLETEPQRIAADHFSLYFISIGQKADTEESNQNNFTNQIQDSRETTKLSNFKTITEENLIPIINNTNITTQAECMTYQEYS